MSSSNTVACPSCQAVLKLPANIPAGRRPRCPKCSQPIPLSVLPPPSSGPGSNPPSDPSSGSKQSVALGSASSNSAASSSRTGKHPPGTTSPTPYEFLAPPELPGELGRLGAYRVLGVLGVGGMGMVFKAEDPTLRRSVALKVMLPQVAQNPTAKARFLREARAQAAVEHDHVIAIHQVSEDRGVPFLAMPLLKGQTLQAVLKLTPRLPLQDLIRIGKETAEGLAAAHEKGLVHRDIKPANIWLEGAKQRVKILDFGLARTTEPELGSSADEPVTKAGAAVGTPAYMSPEQARGMTVDHRTDIFSLGVLMYQMSTGEIPFRGADVMAVLTALALEPAVPPNHRNPEIPQVLSDLILRLLGKNPEERPANADLVAEELKQIEESLFRPAPAPASAVYAQQPMAAYPPGPAAADPWADIDATETGLVIPPTPSAGTGSSKVTVAPSGKTAPHAPAPAVAAIPVPAAPAPPVQKGNNKVLFIAIGAVIGVALLGGLLFFALQFAAGPQGTLNVIADGEVPAELTVLMTAANKNDEITVKLGITKLPVGKYTLELGPEWKQGYRLNGFNVTIMENDVTELRVRPIKKAAPAPAPPMP